MASVELRGVTVRFGDTAVLDDIDLFVADGELVVVTGPSGSGKTTILRTVAGFVNPEAGSVWIGNEDVTHRQPIRRDLAMVFQEYALYPQRTAEGNIEFPLQARRVIPESERKERVRREARNLRIEHILDRKPRELSAGHQQAVATARSLVRSSQALLLDEPLSNLDARFRAEGRVELRRIHREVGATFLYVTNDQSEAMSLADRLVVFDGGRIQQFDPPRKVYDDPANTFVATFLGSPSMSLIPGELAVDGDVVELLIGTDRIHFDRETLDGMPWYPQWDGRPITVGIRPEHLAPASGSEPFVRTLHGRVSAVENLGGAAIVTVGLGIRDVDVKVWLRAPARLEVGDPLELAVSLGRLRFFDPETGSALLASRP